MSRPKAKTKKTSKPLKAIRKKRSIRTLRGMRDIIPQDQKYWRYLIKICEEYAQSYGFEPITTPILEDRSLFERSIGQGTDIVEKELFAFRDLGGDSIALRPELTASICRAYIEHGMVNLPKPVKLYELGPMFRYDRPQSGRYREFNQLSAEIIGSPDPIVDAEVIALSYSIFKTLAIPVVAQVNSIGSIETRKIYRKQLLNFYKGKERQICLTCKKRLKINPMRVLDCKMKMCQELSEETPQIIDCLDPESKTHFMKVLEYLDRFDLPYMLNSRIVRGLDYYNRTTFEIWPEKEVGRKASALGGGGRYDSLIEDLGGRPTPACGIALGLERILALMRANPSDKIDTNSTYNLYLAHLGEMSTKKVLQYFDELRQAGFNVAYNLAKNDLRSQLEAANKLKVKYTLILGQKEIIDETLIIRDMENGIQETVAGKKIVIEMRKRLGIDLKSKG